MDEGCLLIPVFYVRWVVAVSVYKLQGTAGLRVWAVSISSKVKGDI